MKSKTITGSIRELSEGQSVPFPLTRYSTVLCVITRLKKKGYGDYIARTVDRSILRVTCIRRTSEKDLQAEAKEARLMKALDWLDRHSHGAKTGSLVVVLEGTSRMTLSGIPVPALKQLLGVYVREELRLLREEG